MKKIIFVLSFFLLIYTPYIVEADNLSNIIDNIQSPEGFDVQKTAKDAMDGKISFTFSDIAEKIVSLFFGGIKENIPIIIRMTIIAIMSGIVLNIVGEKNEIGIFAACSAVAVIAVKVFSYAITLATETIDTLVLFISSMMPSVATAVSVTGISAGGAAAMTFTAMQIFIHICKTVLLPMVCVICAFSVSDKVGQTPYLDGITSLLKQVLKWGTGLMITIYSVVVGLQAQASVNLDNLAGKSLKYAVGSFVPVVGSALSDSLDTVIAGAKTVAGAIGIAGIIGVGYICLLPLVNICAVSISIKIAGAIASVSAEKRVFEIINEFSQSVGRVAIILLSVAVMFVISLAILCSLGGR